MVNRLLLLWWWSICSPVLTVESCRNSEFAHGKMVLGSRSRCETLGNDRRDPRTEGFMRR